MRALLRDVLCGYLDPDLKSVADDILLESNEGPFPEIQARDLRTERFAREPEPVVEPEPEFEPEPEPEPELEFEPEPVYEPEPELPSRRPWRHRCSSRKRRSTPPRWIAFRRSCRTSRTSTV